MASDQVVVVEYWRSQDKREEIRIAMLQRGPGRFEPVADPAVIVAALIHQGYSPRGIRIEPVAGTGAAPDQG